MVKIYVFPEIAYKPPSRPNPPTDLGIPSMGMIFKAESESEGPRAYCSKVFWLVLAPQAMDLDAT